MKRLSASTWMRKNCNLPTLAQLERLSIDTDPPDVPRELPAYRPMAWETDARDPEPYPTSDTETVARCLWSPKPR